MTTLRSTQVISAPAADVWRDVLAIEMYPGFVDSVLGVRTIAWTSQSARTCAWTIDIEGDTLAWISIESIDEDRLEVNFRQVIGSFERMEGRWSVDPIESESIVQLEIEYSVDDKRLKGVLDRDGEGERLRHLMDEWLSALGRWSGSGPQSRS